MMQVCVSKLMCLFIFSPAKCLLVKFSGIILMLSNNVFILLIMLFTYGLLRRGVAVKSMLAETLHPPNSASQVLVL